MRNLKEGDQRKYLIKKFIADCILQENWGLLKIAPVPEDTATT
jgi:hypothetical protein